MAASPARSIDSSILVEDDATITLGGLANDDHEPMLVNKSPIAPLAIKPVLTIDEVTAAHGVSVGALRPRLPQETGGDDGFLRQPAFLELAVFKPEDADANSALSADAPQAQATHSMIVEEPKAQLNAWAPSFLAMIQENVCEAKAELGSIPSSPDTLQETVYITMTGSEAATDQAGKLGEGEILTENELQLTIVPHINAIDVDEQDLTPVRFNAVAEKLLNDAQFIEQVGRRVISAQGVPQRQLGHVAGSGARSVLVINYSQSLIRYCEAADLPPPRFTFEVRGSGENKKYRATASVGKPRVTFKKPVAAGQFGHKRQVREDAAQAAFEYLVSSGAIQGTGFFVGQRQHPIPPSATELGGRLIDRYVPPRNSLSGVSRVATDGNSDIDSEDEAEPRPLRRSQRLASSGGHLEAARPQALANSRNCLRIEEAGSRVVRATKSPPINPARLHMLQGAAPMDDQDIPPTFLTELGPLNSGANVAPLGRKRFGFENSSSTAGPQPIVTTADPRQKFHDAPNRSAPAPPEFTPAPPAFQANRPYLTPQKRERDQFEGNSLAKRQLSEIGRAMGPQSTNKAASKSMTGLVGYLSGTAAPLARVAAICKYISIQSPQYFEVSRDGERIQWGAHMPANYLNANEITLGPTVLTWNEVLGKTTCARQFVEPYLMAGIKLHGFGSRQDTQIERGGEPVAKRQKLGEPCADGGMHAMSDDYNTVRDDVEQFVQEVKEEVIKTEPVD